MSYQVGGYTEAENQYKKDLEDNNPDAKKMYDAKLNKLEKEADYKINNTERGNFDAYHEFVENNRRVSKLRYKNESAKVDYVKANKYKEKDDFLKTKGDKYERYIGEKFERQGHLVIYTGYIYGYKDQGVDIISISPESKVINLIQCKNWTNKQMSIGDIQDIYYKLENINWDFIYFLKKETIKEHHSIVLNEILIWDTLYDMKKHREEFKIRKTLYVASDKVMDLDIGHSLTMINPNIFRYEDMKIVITKEV